MELQKTTSRILAFLALMLCLGGCETHLNSEPLEIIGDPPKEMYYDSEFKYQFGVKGGNGRYTYRYIANPDDEDGSSNTGGELGGAGNNHNPVELRTDPLVENKPGFWLKGMPSAGFGDDGVELGDQEYTYALEVSDGASTVRREYTFTLKKNELVLSAQVSSVREKQVKNTQAKCGQNVERTFDASVVNGQDVYPLVMRVSLKAKPSRKVEIGYHFVSGYVEGEGELAEINHGLARPNVDYLDETRTLVFEENNMECFIYLNVLDDHLVEKFERLAVQFSPASGAQVSTAGVSGEIIINDDEPTPEYDPVNLTANEGDTVVTEFSLSKPHEQSVDILVRVLPDKTTATDDDFSLQPSTGRVTIPAGRTNASYSVSLLHNDDAGEIEDDVVSIRTSLDQISDNDPLEIAINKWRVTNEVVARQSEGSEVVDFVYGEGKIFVLSKISTAGENALTLTVFNATDGVAIGSVVRVAQQGLNLSPVAIRYADSGDILVAANIDGRFNGLSHYGGSDFIVFSFGENDAGGYQLNQSAQFGSTGDDVVRGLKLGQEGVFAFGSVTGIAAEDDLSGDWNGGNSDGFVYRLRSSQLTETWVKLVGTPDDDVVVDVDIGRNELIVLANTQNADIADTDVFMRALNVSDGATEVFLAADDAELPRTQLNLSSHLNEMGAKTSFIDAGTKFSTIVNSDADLPLSDPTPSRSQDGFMIFFDAESGNSSNTIKLATSLDDSVAALGRLNEDDVLAVGGTTKGEFEGQIRKGTDNDDAFVARIETGLSGQSTLTKVTQFGTLSNDEVIKIERINDYKFMVLWSESTTSGDGSMVYRLSPFSIDGTKLTPDP